MIKDIVTKKNQIFEKINQLDTKLKETSNILQNIPLLSRLSTVTEKPFKVIDKERMDYITEQVQEINEKIYIFSKSDTQVTRKLMTLTMLYPADSVYRQLQQISAQIEKKQMALSENQINLAKEQVKYQRIKNKLDNEEYDDEYQKIEYELELQSIVIKISNSLSYIEAAIKEIGYLLEAYNQIKKNKNISDDWDELDFEKEEIRTHIKSAFRNGLRDYLVHGRIGMGTCEYFEQFGISPVEAITEIQNYLNYVNSKIASDENIPDFNDLYKWLNKMADKYEHCYKKICKWIGLDPEHLISTKFTLITNDKRKG